MTISLTEANTNASIYNEATNSQTIQGWGGHMYKAATKQNIHINTLNNVQY